MLVILGDTSFYTFYEGNTTHVAGITYALS